MPAASETFDVELARTVGTRLAAIARAHAPAVLASSFGAEDMVLIDLIARDRLPIRVFTLDTGRLHQETTDLIDMVRRHYGIGVDVHVPDTAVLEAYVRDHGLNAFYDSVELRQRCCEIRKTEPLRRALIGAHAWITGQRRGQGITRADLPLRAVRPGARPAQVQSSRRMERGPGVVVPAHPRGAGQRAACPRLSQHRLRALHPAGRPRRGQPRRTLVVGAAGAS